VIRDVPLGNATILARLLGFKPVERTLPVRAGDTTRVELRLEPEATVLSAVVTQARPVERDVFESRPSVGTVQITAHAAEGVPKFGEPDIIRVVQLLPGVEARNVLDRIERRGASPTRTSSSSTAIRSTSRFTWAGYSARSSIRRCRTSRS
jgi:hypothetical protein